jgi:hypothetical protein
MKSGGRKLAAELAARAATINQSGRGVERAAEFGDRIGRHIERLADGAHDFEGDALGFASFEQVDRAQGDACAFCQIALAEEFVFTDAGQWRRRCFGHASATSLPRDEYATDARVPHVRPDIVRYLY